MKKNKSKGIDQIIFDHFNSIPLEEHYVVFSFDKKYLRERLSKEHWDFIHSTYYYLYNYYQLISFDKDVYVDKLKRNSRFLNYPKKNKNKKDYCLLKKRSKKKALKKEKSNEQLLKEEWRLKKKNRKYRKKKKKKSFRFEEKQSIKAERKKCKARLKQAFFDYKSYYCTAKERNVMLISEEDDWGEFIIKEKTVLNNWVYCW